MKTKHVHWLGIKPRSITRKAATPPTLYLVYDALKRIIFVLSEASESLDAVHQRLLNYPILNCSQSFSKGVNKISRILAGLYIAEHY